MEGGANILQMQLPAGSRVLMLCYLLESEEARKQIVLVIGGPAA